MDLFNFFFSFVILFFCCWFSVYLIYSVYIISIITPNYVILPVKPVITVMMCNDIHVKFSGGKYKGRPYQINLKMKLYNNTIIQSPSPEQG